MGRVRVFYGHEGVVPPLGLRAPAAAAPASVDDEVVEYVSTDPLGDPIELVGEPIDDAAGDDDELVGDPIEPEGDLPDEDWTNAEIDDWAAAREVDLAGAKKKRDKLALIAAHLGSE